MQALQDEEDQILFNDVVATLNDLGHYNRLTNKYQLNLNDHNVCLRDLIRFLRNDGQNFIVRRQMGISNIVDNDLIPIIEQHTLNDNKNIDENGKSLMDKIIRLLVDLTNPTILHYSDQKIPKDDKYEMNIYMELQKHLFQYKLSFSLHKRFWIVITKYLSRILELDTDDRQVEDEMMMERIIILIRNVLHIPIIARNGQLDDINVHDRIVEHINNYGLLDILLYMINNDEYRQYCFHILEIVYLMFREQNAEFLAKSVESDRKQKNEQQSLSSHRSQYEREIDNDEFEQARLRDRKEREQMMAKFKSDDYTRFKETAFIIKNMKAVSDRDMICYRAYSNPEKAIDFNKNKIAQRRPRNRRPMNESVGNSDSFGAQRIHRSSKQLRSILYDFCSKFLSESYNQFMAEIRSNLIRGSSQEHDETYFLWACQFFMEFNRYQTIDLDREKKYQQIHETLSTSMFHYIQTIVDDYMDHLVFKKEFKNEIGDWSKRLHQALRSYRELLFSLSYIESLNLPSATKMCYHVKTDIFTEPEYREMLLRLMQAYNEEKMSKAYLRDLIETNHLFLKMLEYHAKISLDFKIKVKKRKSSKKINKKKDKEKNDDNETKKDENDADQSDLSPDMIWMAIIDEVNEILNSELDTESILDEELLKKLFDPLADRTLDEQKLSILRMIQKFLLQKDVKKAVCLYREARNALSGLDDENVFGEIGIQIEDEMLALNGILMTEFPKEKSKSLENDDNDDEQQMNEIEAEDSFVVQEKKFSIDETLMRYAHPNVVRSCRLLLKNYRTNSSTTNHAIVRMLYRLAVDLKMKPMFYNLGYFVIFEQIFDDPLLKNGNNKSSQYKSLYELATFAYYIIKNFFKLLFKYPKIASEVCFIVNSREACQMECGFDHETVEQIIREKKGLSWSDQQKLELEVLFNEYKDKTTKDKDVVDLIQEHLIDDTKTRRQILIQLKKMNLLSSDDLKKNSHKGPAWSKEELDELKSLYEKFKDNLEFVDHLPKDESLTTTIVEAADSQTVDETDADNVSNLKSNKNKKQLDIIDCILKHLSTSSQRNRRQIIRQLKIEGIYDHSMKNKWSKESIEELRTLFCNLFIDFKQSLDDEDAEMNGINENTQINKDNFMDKLMEKFSDKSKSYRQIRRQLSKMDFDDQLKLIGMGRKLSNDKNEDEQDEPNSDDENSDDNPEENDNANIYLDLMGLNDGDDDDDDDDEVIRQYDDDEDDDNYNNYDANIPIGDVSNNFIPENNMKKSFSFEKIHFDSDSENDDDNNIKESMIHLNDYIDKFLNESDDSINQSKRKFLESDNEDDDNDAGIELSNKNGINETIDEISESNTIFNKRRRMIILDDDDDE